VHVTFCAHQLELQFRAFVDREDAIEFAQVDALFAIPCVARLRDPMRYCALLNRKRRTRRVRRECARELHDAMLVRVHRVHVIVRSKSM
jgi:hypothetical protein